MSEPERWPEVMRWTYGTMVPTYFLCMCVGYYAYGDFAQSNINRNFPRGVGNVMSMGTQLAYTFYLIFYTNIVNMMRVEMTLLVRNNEQRTTNNDEVSLPSPPRPSPGCVQVELG